MSHEPTPDVPPQMPSRRALVSVSAAILATVVGVGIVGALPRWAKRVSAREEIARAEAEPIHVETVKPTTRRSGQRVELPGTIEAVRDTTVYARTNGYLRRYLADIGDTVKEGQVLAEIDTPELDQELGQAKSAVARAKAAIAQAKARRELAETSARRYDALRDKGLVSQQEYDERLATAHVEAANAQAAEADLAASEANVRRLTEMKSFSRVVAPFAGVVTARLVDVGTLVTAGNGNGQALFRVASDDVVRVFVHVPQSDATGTTEGLAAHVRVRELPGRTFDAKVTRTSRSLDPTTRTLLAEIRIDNRDHALVAGMYAQVDLDAPSGADTLSLPATCVQFDGEGTRVAVVEDGRIHWRPVVIERDLGSMFVLASGVGPDDLVVASVSDRLLEGTPADARVAAPKP